VTAIKIIVIALLDLRQLIESLETTLGNMLNIERAQEIDMIKIYTILDILVILVVVKEIIVIDIVVGGTTVLIELVLALEVGDILISHVMNTKTDLKGILVLLLGKIMDASNVGTLDTDLGVALTLFALAVTVRDTPVKTVMKKVIVTGITVTMKVMKTRKTTLKELDFLMTQNDYMAVIIALGIR